MSFYDDKAATINDLVAAVIAVENELGILPSGVYASVRTRLDILEARINDPLAPAPNTLNPFFIGNTGVSVQTQIGDPNILNILAIPGSLYLRQDGYNNQGLYTFRDDGYWHQIDTDPWTAGGDLSGTIYSQTVIGIQGRPVSAAIPNTDSEGDGYVLTWGSDGYWEPQIGFFAAGDLSGNKLNQTVINLQGHKLSVSSPANATVLTWNNGVGQWEPQQPAVIFDPIDTPTATNIRSNRLTTQSPIDNTQIGIVNLSSRSTGATTGVTASYSSILGGDRNQVSGTTSVITGGLLNTINGSNANMFIGGGNNNILNGDSSSIVGGDNNAVSDANSLIGGGKFNTISSTGGYNTIVGGQNGTITSTTTQSLIGSGLNNIISVSSNGLILNGNSNTVNANFGTIINGSNNFVNGIYSTTFGDSNTISDGYGLIQGFNNIITSGTNKYITIFGDFNTANSNSHYSSIWGSSNTVSDGYVSVFGDGNTISSGATYSNIHGHVNTISSLSSTIFGSNNTIDINSRYSTIFGTSNRIDANSSNDFVFGSNNTTLGPYISTWGNSNIVSHLSDGYSNVWGSSNTISGDWSNTFGLSHSIFSVNYTLVHGAYGIARNSGQYTHAANSFTGVAGESQFSRMILNGSAASGAAISLTLDGTHNILTESGKAYDMEIRILVTNTTTAGICARYVFGILAHNESSTLVIDRLDAILINDNGTNWMVNNWTSSLFSISGSNLVITVPSAAGSVYPSDNRRAVATVEWREVTRL